MGRRIELDWPNKELFLLTPRDEEGKPRWVERNHPAASEVRISSFGPAYGQVLPDPHSDNLVFTGDSIDVLRVLTQVPEFADCYRGQVKAVYIDPPFNTGLLFKDYDDWMEHSTWLSFMRERLFLIKDLLRRDGTLWLHLDNHEIHRMRCLLDEVFGAGMHLATVTWQRTSAKSLARTTMGTMFEQILVYGAGPEATLRPLFLPLEEEYVTRRYTNYDDRGRYDTGDLTATSYRPHLDSGKPWRGFDPSARRRCWAVPTGPLLEAGYTEADLAALTMRAKLDALDEHGYIHWPEGGGFPRFKKYAHKAKGRQVGDLWTDINVINSQAKERRGYDTQKPEALVERVLELATEPGDIVLDCFAGSGTTAAVAHKMGRRWVTADILPTTVEDYVLPRLRDVVDGADDSGISPKRAWAGGGGFRTVAIGPSMYELGPGGVVLLADWAVNGEFAAAVAGQLGFERIEASPFCGVRGRMKLAVFDGAVGPEEIEALAFQLAEREKVTVVARIVLPGTEDRLRALVPGSRIRKAPRDLLNISQRAPRRPRATRAAEAGAPSVEVPAQALPARTRVVGEAIS